jgi:hypothetical protein
MAGKAYGGRASLCTEVGGARGRTDDAGRSNLSSHFVIMVWMALTALPEML